MNEIDLAVRSCAYTVHLVVPKLEYNMYYSEKSMLQTTKSHEV